MSGAYFNYSTQWSEDWWGRRAFVRAWWQLYQGDPRAVPPDYPSFVRHVHTATKPSADAGGVVALHLEALPRRTGTTPSPQAPIVPAAYFEEAVAAALVQLDPTPGSDTAYLSLLRCANDEEALDRLLGAVMEALAPYDRTRLVGPCGLLPAWQSGALLDHFHRLPPLHTPYNPPYLPELLGATLEPWLETRLFVAEVPPKPALPAAGPARLWPLEPVQLAGDLLPLLRSSLAATGPLPLPTTGDASRLLQWLAAYPLTGWFAEADGIPAGFVLLQPDFAALVRRTGGGRHWPWRGYALWRKHAGAPAGRLLLGAVAPAYRGQGIGRQLWQQAMQEAAAAGWRELSCGPVPRQGEAAAFLARQGAHPRQRYMLYRWSAW